MFILATGVLHHGTKNIERQYLFIFGSLFQPFGKIKIAGSYEDKPTLHLQKSQGHSSEDDCRYNCLIETSTFPFI